MTSFASSHADNMVWGLLTPDDALCDITNGPARVISINQTLALNLWTTSPSWKPLQMIALNQE